MENAWEICLYRYYNRTNSKVKRIFVIYAYMNESS